MTDTGRDSTGIKHKEHTFFMYRKRKEKKKEKNIHSILFPSFVNNRKKNERRPRMVSFIQILDLIWGWRWKGNHVLGFKKYPVKFSQ